VDAGFRDGYTSLLQAGLAGLKRAGLKPGVDLRVYRGLKRVLKKAM
jgi:hypothetical protein